MNRHPDEPVQPVTGVNMTLVTFAAGRGGVNYAGWIENATQRLDPTGNLIP